MRARVKRYFVSTDGNGSTVVGNAPTKENMIPAYMYRAERPGERHNNKVGPGGSAPPTVSPAPQPDDLAGSGAHGSVGNDAHSNSDGDDSVRGGRRRKKRRGVNALQFASCHKSIQFNDTEEERLKLKLDRRLNCGVCTQSFDIRMLPYQITKKAILEQRTLWGRSQLTSSQLIPSNLYAKVRICAFCGQFFGMERDLMSDQVLGTSNPLEAQFDDGPYLRKNARSRVRAHRADYRRSVLLEAQREEEEAEIRAKGKEYELLAQQVQLALEDTQAQQQQDRVRQQQQEQQFEFSLSNVVSLDASPVHNKERTMRMGGGDDQSQHSSGGAVLLDDSTNPASQQVSPMNKPPRPSRSLNPSSPSKSDDQEKRKEPDHPGRKKKSKLNFLERFRAEEQVKGDNLAVSAIHRQQIEARTRRDVATDRAIRESMGAKSRGNRKKFEGDAVPAKRASTAEQNLVLDKYSEDLSSISWHSPPPCRRDTKTMNTMLDKLSEKMKQQRDFALVQRRHREQNKPALDLSSLGLLKARSFSGSLKQKDGSRINSYS